MPKASAQINEKTGGAFADMNAVIESELNRLIGYEGYSKGQSSGDSAGWFDTSQDTSRDNQSAYDQGYADGSSDRKA